MISMESIINIGYNNTYKWYNNGKIYVIGSIYYNDEFLSGEKFVHFIEKNKDKLKTLLNKLTGFYSIIINDNEQILLISDVMRTFPLFYSTSNNTIEISDNINFFSNKSIDQKLCNELIELRYIVGNNTIYKDIYQMQSNEIITINNNGKIKSERYYDFKSQNKLIEKKDVFKNITTTFDLAIDKLIKYANGRPIILPLSGGYDSRQILLSLHKKKYNNVICYTYGKNIKEEALISKKLAEKMGYKWYFIKYDNKKMKKIYYNKKMYGNLVDYISRGFSSPHIQEWASIKYLKENDLLPNNSIIAPGFTGDALSGSHISKEFFTKKEYTKEELLKQIIDYNFIITNNYTDNALRLENTLSIKKNKLNLQETLDYYNKYDFEERQVKYITNSVRIYDYYGYEWYLPFWDKGYINTWMNIDIKHKYNRNALAEYFNNEYHDLMKEIPIYQKETKNKNKNIIIKIINILKHYYNDNLNLYGYLKYTKYLRTYISKRVVSYDYSFGYDYIKYIKRGNRK